jgi:hypothetical protein
MLQTKHQTPHQLSILGNLDAKDAILACRATLLTEIVHEAFTLAEFAPEILTAMSEDIDAAAKEAKKVRLMDEIWWDAKLPLFPSFTERVEPGDFDTVPAESLKLFEGRPRACDPELALVLVAVNGVFSLSSAPGYERLSDSTMFEVVLEAKGFDMPKRSTVAKYLGLISGKTMQLIHNAQMRLVLSSELDDLLRLTVDSTAVAANSAWPSESGLIWGHLARAARLLEKQGELSGVTWASKLVGRWLSLIKKSHTAISMLGSVRGARRKRKNLYRKLLKAAEKALARLESGVASRIARLEERCLQPSNRIRVDSIMDEVRYSLGECARAMNSARLRVLQGEKVAADSKSYSVCDPDAYMVVKGQRDPVIGYKPQFGRSLNGFITCFEVDRGNPADSDRLLPMVEQCVSNTGVNPAEVSTDDGYTSTGNFDALLAKGVELVSFSGAKGRKVLGEELWSSAEHNELRDDRSTVESTIFTVKHKFDLRSFCRRGLDGVRMELAGTVFAFNLWRTSYMRRIGRPQLSASNVAA